MSPARRAARIGGYALSHVTAAGKGRVHSIFEHGLNVSFARRPGFLLYLQGFSQGLSCLGMQLDARSLNTLLGVARVGARASICGNDIFVESQGSATAVVSLVGMEVIDTRLCHVLGPDSVRRLMGLLPWAQIYGNAGLDWNGPSRRALGALRDNEGDDGELRKGISYLLGRGRGLTPSGDDILVGFGLGLQALGRKGPFKSVLREELSRITTTDVSQAQLKAMTFGNASESFLELVRAASGGAWGRVPCIVESIRRIGHSSGNDLLVGFGQALGVRLGTWSGNGVREGSVQGIGKVQTCRCVRGADERRR